MPVDLEAELDGLFGAELDRFVAERTKLVRSLKAEGRRVEAARMQELRKPSLPAWAVNRLVRRNRGDVARLLDAGAALEEAQAALLSGGSQDAFAAAREAERSALLALRAPAEATLGDRASEATLERVDATLRAAAATAAGREQLSEGRLSVELEPRGFEALAGLAPAAGRPTKRAAARPKAGRDDARKEAVARARAALDEAKGRERELARGRREAERDAERARAAHETAVEEVTRLRRELDAAKKG